MKTIYLVVQNIASYDGELLLSIWSSREEAESEIQRLSNDYTTLEIKEVKIDVPNGVETGIVV